MKTRLALSDMTVQEREIHLRILRGGTQPASQQDETQQRKIDRFNLISDICKDFLACRVRYGANPPTCIGRIIPIPGTGAILFRRR
jgi:hypothetical protein